MPLVMIVIAVVLVLPAASTGRVDGISFIGLALAAAAIVIQTIIEFEERDDHE